MGQPIIAAAFNAPMLGMAEAGASVPPQTMTCREAGRRGGLRGGRSRSAAKRRAARENIARARQAWQARLKSLVARTPDATVA